MHLNTDFFVVGNYAFGSNGRIMIYPKKNCGSSRLWNYTRLNKVSHFYPQMNFTEIEPKNHLHNHRECIAIWSAPFILMRESFGRLNARYESVIILIIMGMHIYTNLLIRGLALLVWHIFWRSSTRAELLMYLYSMQYHICIYQT